MSDPSGRRAIRQLVVSEVYPSNPATRRPLYRPRGFGSLRIIGEGIARPCYDESRAHKEATDAVRPGSLKSFLSFY